LPWFEYRITLHHTQVFDATNKIGVLTPRKLNAHDHAHDEMVPEQAPKRQRRRCQQPGCDKSAGPLAKVGAYRGLVTALLLASEAGGMPRKEEGRGLAGSIIVGVTDL